MNSQFWNSVFLNWDYNFFSSYDIDIPSDVAIGSGRIDGVTDGSGILHIEGDIAAPNDGEDSGATYILANFSEGSSFKGAAYTDIKTTLTNEELDAQYQSNWLLWMRFAGENTYWDVTGDSQVSTLVLEEGARIILANHGNDPIDPDAGILPGFGSYVLDIRNFSGSSYTGDPEVDNAHAGVFHIDLDYSNPDNPESGFISVIGSVDKDKPYAVVEVAATGQTTAETTIPIALDSTPEHNLKLGLKPIEIMDNLAAVEMGAYLYELESAVDETGEYVNEFAKIYGDENFSESGDVIWFLSRTPTASPTANDVVSASGFGPQIAAYLGHLSTLRDRMGEVRWKGENGLWARATAMKNRLTGIGGTSHEDKIRAGYFGYDRTIGSWTVGADVRFATSDVDSHGLTNLTSDGDAVGGALYATWHGEAGSYVDVVLSADRYSEELSGIMTDRVTRYEGDYDAFGWGASIEVGHRFDFGAARSWYLEPSAQLSYYRVEGERFKLTNGMTVDQGDATSITGRLGFAAGYAWRDADMLPIGTVFVEAGVNHEFDAEQRIAANDLVYKGDLLGTRVYYALGATKRLGENVLFWAKLGREEGSDYTQEYDTNIGIRWAF